MTFVSQIYADLDMDRKRDPTFLKLCKKILFVNKMVNDPKILTPVRIADLDGKPIRLSSKYCEGKLLTIDKFGTATLEDKNTDLDRADHGYDSADHSYDSVDHGYDSADHNHDQHWRLVPDAKKGGFKLISARDGYMICHYIEDGGVVKTRQSYFGECDGCIWKIGKGGEIYQAHPKGGERYLWLADDKLFVTLDGYLAENWEEVEENVEKFTQDSFGNGIMMAVFVIIIIVAAIFIYQFYKSWR